MAVVLVVRPYGLLGRAHGAVRNAAAIDDPLQPAGRGLKLFAAAVLAVLLAIPFLAKASPYALVLGNDVLIAVLFAASLHFIAGPGGMHSFGHAAYFGLGCYGAGLLLKLGGMPMLGALALAPFIAGLGAALFGWFSVRLSGVYLAMLTLAFAQIVWAIVFQWEQVTGGSNGVIGLWPPAPFNINWVYYLVVLASTVAGVLMLRRILFSPFGYAMRAGRDSPLRAEATGIAVLHVHWVAFIIAGTLCGLGGALFAFAKGGISPETIHVARSIDGLVMVLLGGIQNLAGPLVGAPVYTVLQDTVMRQTPYWRGVLGAIILLIVLVFPGGIAGTIADWFKRART
jgi:branched-chain amino acid transport system permease protein